MSVLARAAKGAPRINEDSAKTSAAGFVPVDTPEERLSALQEDLGMMLAQTARRKDVERSRPNTADDTEQVLEEDREQRMFSLARLCRTERGDLRDFLRQARRLFPDDSDLVLALRAQRRMSTGVASETASAGAGETYATSGKAATTSELVRFLERAVETLYREGDPRRIKAGINVADGARRYGMRLNLPATVMRNLYRDFLDFADALPDLYDDWITRFEYEQRMGIAQFIGTMLITDRRALDPSCTHVVFSSLFMQGNVLRMMASAEQAFRQLTPARSDGTTDAGLERAVTGLLTTVMRDPKQTTQAVRALCVHAENLSVRERFIQQIYGAFAALPIALYPDVTARHTLLSGILGLTTPCF
jgi:type III secretion protein W